MNDDVILETINSRSYCVPGIKFDIDKANEVLSQGPFFDNHVWQGKTNPMPLGSSPWMCNHPHDTIRAPGMIELACRFHPVASVFLQASAFVYSMNCFYTQPNLYTKGDIQQFHRDRDDDRFLALFIYGTDILDVAAGPHEIKVGTHTGAEDGPVEQIYGEKGTIFLSASFAYHRGLIPSRGRRQLLWIRYGISNPPAAYHWDQLTPLPKERAGYYPTDPELRRCMSLVVA